MRPWLTAAALLALPAAARPDLFTRPDLAPCPCEAHSAGGGGGGLRSRGVQWEPRFDQALRKAVQAHKPLMVDFWAEWCNWCHQLDRTTYVDADVVKRAAGFVTVKVDTEGGRQQALVAQRYDVSSLPTILFLSPSGRLVLRVNGYQGPGNFPRTMDTAREMAERVMGWEAALQRDPEDPVALAELGTHLFEQEVYEDSRDLLSRAARRDGRRPVDERKRTRMLLGIIQKYDEKYAAAERVLKEALGLRPAGEYDPKILYVLGKTYISWGKPDQARAALQQVVKEHAGSPVAAKAREQLVALNKK
jgi:thioredoxin-like negative regulator of GroEL